MLGLYWWDGLRWVKEPTNRVNLVANTVTATPEHTSLWAVLAQRKQQIFIPVISAQ
jgi:hypothetical protein